MSIQMQVSFRIESTVENGEDNVLPLVAYNVVSKRARTSIRIVVKIQRHECGDRAANDDRRPRKRRANRAEHRSRGVAAVTENRHPYERILRWACLEKRAHPGDKSAEIEPTIEREKHVVLRRNPVRWLVA